MRRKLTMIALGVAGATLLSIASPARADVYDDNPAAASRGPDDIWLFARRTTDGATLVRHWIGAGWSDWESLGGAASSGPAAASYAGSIYVFVRGLDGAIYSNHLVGTGWSGWTSIGGYASSAPAASVRRGGNYLDVSIRGGDNQLYLNVYVPGQGWSGWQGGLGGNLTAGTASVSQSDPYLNIFARFGDGRVYQKPWDGTKWLDWISLDGNILGAPQVVTASANSLDLYARGFDNLAYQRHWDGTNGWGAWILINGDRTGISSSPAAASDLPSREMLFVRQGEEITTRVWTAEAGWSGWSSLGSIAVPTPAPPPVPTPEGEVGLQAGLGCTPLGGKLKVTVRIHKRKGHKRARVVRVTFFTRGKGRHVRVDHHRPWLVHLKIDKPRGTHGKVYARVYFRRSKHGKLHKKVVSRRFTVCA